MAAVPGIIEKVYIAGESLDLNPSQLADEPQRAQAVERFLDMVANIDRPDILSGLAPDVTSKHRFALAWSRIKTTDDTLLRAVRAYSGFLDFTPWRMVTETFTATSGTLTYKLARRLALSELASGFHPNITTHLATKVYDAAFGGTLLTVTTHYSFGAADSSGRTPITFVSQPDVFRVEYCPLYSVFVADESAQAAFNAEWNQSIVLEER